jgi:uncharacterized protein (TIGR03581 family)
MTLIEPTGGIDLDNFGIILQSCLEAGVPRVMPHVYSSIIDPQTGNTSRRYPQINGYRESRGLDKNTGP